MVETVTLVSRSFNREIPWAETMTPMSRFSTEALGWRVGGDTGSRGSERRWAGGFFRVLCLFRGDVL